MRKEKGTTNQTTKEPIYKKWWFGFIIVTVIACAIGGPGQYQTAEPDASPAPTQPEAPAAIESDPVKQFVSEVTEAIQDKIDTKHESIIGVALLDRELFIYVDFTDVILDAVPVTLEDLGISRTSSITGEILALDGYDDLWDTIIVNFGEIGQITLGKDAIETNEHGRYFSSKNFKFERS